MLLRPRWAVFLVGFSSQFQAFNNLFPVTEEVPHPVRPSVGPRKTEISVSEARQSNKGQCAEEKKKKKEQERNAEFRMKGTKSGGGRGTAVRWREALKIGGHRRNLLSPEGMFPMLFTLVEFSLILLVR